ncbi:MAG: hypothetical protein ACTS5Y_13415, partial [Pollutimonas bauzanensis]
ALALGLGLAFGLGGRETAADIVEKLYGKAQARSDQLKEAAHNAGERAPRKPAADWPTDGYPQGGGAGGPVPADRRRDIEGG